MTPRGIRNNNPLNIRHGDNWQGLSVEQTDASFCQFRSMEWGLRAAFIILKNYIQGWPRVDTVRAIISRWAPPIENDTEQYIKSVCQKGLFQDNDRIAVPEKNKMCRLVWAMAWVENGVEISFGRVENSYHLAFHR